MVFSYFFDTFFFSFGNFLDLQCFHAFFFSCFCFTLQAPVELQYGMLYAYLYLEVSHHRWALGCETTGKQTSGLRALGAQFSTSALAFHARRFTGAPNGTGQGGRFLRVDALQQNKTPWSLQLNPVRVQGTGGRKHLWQFHISAILCEATAFGYMKLVWSVRYQIGSEKNSLKSATDMRVPPRSPGFLIKAEMSNVAFSN